MSEQSGMSDAPAETNDLCLSGIFGKIICCVFGATVHKKFIGVTNGTEKSSKLHSGLGVM